MSKVEIYTSKFCGYCSMAKRLLNEKQVEYIEYSVDGDYELRQEMERRSEGYTVPQVFINGRSVGGFTDIYQLDQNGELDELLAE